MTFFTLLALMSPRAYLRPFLATMLMLPTSWLVSRSVAASFTWNGTTTGTWTTPLNWNGGTAPTGGDATDVLTFGGDTTTVDYTATNDVGTIPFLVNRVVNATTDSTGTGRAAIVTGNALRFAGVNPQIVINGTGQLNFRTPIQLRSDLTVTGSGTGRVTLSEGISGWGNIIMAGGSAGTLLRFGTNPPSGQTAPSANTWRGKLVIQGGEVRFNNNAQSAATALRANMVEFTGNGQLIAKRDVADQLDGFETSLRFGTLQGNTGTVNATVVDDNGNALAEPVDNYDIVITAMKSGSFGGTIILPAPINGGNDGGKLVIRGVAEQTLIGTTNIYKDVALGRSATLRLAGTATLGNQTTGALTFNGGTMVLDNTGGNVASVGRLRNTGGTTVETIGGGRLQLIGNAVGTTEVTARLQLGTFSAATSQTRPRSGHLEINATHQIGATGATVLQFASYSRDQQTRLQFSTVDFSASLRDAGGNLTGTVLGNTGNAPRIQLNGSSTVTLTNGLLGTTSGISSVGWATVNGTDFATHDATLGVRAVTTTGWTTSLPATANALITGNASTPATAVDYTVNSIKITPTAIGQSLNIAGTGHLSASAVLLAGAIDFLIDSTGGGGFAGSSTRFIHVERPATKLTIKPNIAPLPSSNQPLVKSGQGILEFLSTDNALFTEPLVVNAGIVRANHFSGTLPSGEIRLRGGVIEILGGNTFSRNIGTGANTINWSGVVNNAGVLNDVDEDRGSGGFAAFGADVIVDLGAPGASALAWEERGFIRSGHAFVLGTKTATHKITLIDHLNLSEANSDTVNYNARELRVENNPATAGDFAVITGTVSGNRSNDLLKTGDGTLVLAAAALANTYQGATIIHEGTLRVNTNNQASFSHEVSSGATLGGNGRASVVRVEAGATLAPGNAEGMASILRTQDLMFLGMGAKLAIDLGGTNAGGDTTTGYDQIEVTGSVVLNNADLEITALGGFLASGASRFFLILNDGVDPVEGQFIDGAQVQVGSQTFNISYTANSETGLLTGGNDVAIELIPEASGVLLLGAALLVISGVRRRRA